MMNSNQQRSVQRAIVAFILPVILICGIIWVLPRTKHTGTAPTIRSYAAIYQDPYPEATLIEHTTQPTFYMLTLATSASKAEVRRWYEQTYLAHGWEHIVTYANPEYAEEEYTIDYRIDWCRRLALSVIYAETRHTFTHRVELIEGRCQRQP